jgi:predicted transcriptional regulator
MNVKIEVDETTASTLAARAAERGLTVPQLVAEMAAEQGAPVSLPSDELAELDRQWAAIKAGERTVPHDQVVRWLETWGTPAFRPWNNR